MTREERKIYQIGVLVAAALIIAMTAVVTEECSAKTAAYADTETAGEEISTETSRESEIGQIREHNASHRIQRVETLEETDEPETEKETENEAARRTASEADRDHALGNDTRGKRGNFGSSTADAGSHEADGGTAPEPLYYRIAGELIDPDIQRTIYKALEAENLTDWYTGALAQCFQESRGDRFAVSKNGLDMGIFQYREPFWNYYSNGDIFDPEAQAILYAKEMARRFNAGLSVDEAISRHYTSDYHTEVDWEYVGQVRQWLGQMEVVR